MKGRVPFWFVAAVLGTMPLIALAFLSHPVTAAGLWFVAPGEAVDAATGTHMAGSSLGASDKSVNLTSSTPGQTLRYTIRLANAGPGTIAKVVVTDTLPSGLTYRNGS